MAESEGRRALRQLRYCAFAMVVAFMSTGIAWLLAPGIRPAETVMLGLMVLGSAMLGLGYWRVRAVYKRRGKL